jgi:hypothetical protein
MSDFISPRPPRRGGIEIRIAPRDFAPGIRFQPKILLQVQRYVRPLEIEQPLFRPGQHAALGRHQISRAARDIWRRGGLHPAFVAGASFLFLGEFGESMLYFDPVWKSIATTIVKA